MAPSHRDVKAEIELNYYFESSSTMTDYYGGREGEKRYLAIQRGWNHFPVLFFAFSLSTFKNEDITVRCS